MQCHCFNRVQLLGHFHGADLCRKCRARAADHDDGGYQGSKFAGDGYRNHVRNQIQGAETPQFVGPLKGHDNADEERYEGNDGNSGDPNRHCLMDGALKTQAALQRRDNRICHGAPQQLSQTSDVSQALFCRGPDIQKKFHAFSYWPAKACSSVSNTWKTPSRFVSLSTSRTVVPTPNNTKSFCRTRACFNTSTNVAMPALSTYRIPDMFRTSRGVAASVSNNLVRKPCELEKSIAPSRSTTVFIPSRTRTEMFSICVRLIVRANYSCRRVVWTSRYTTRQPIRASNSITGAGCRRVKVCACKAGSSAKKITKRIRTLSTR